MKSEEHHIHLMRLDDIGKTSHSLPLKMVISHGFPIHISPRHRDFVMRWAATPHLCTTPGRVVNVPGLTPHAVVVARVAIHQRLIRHVPGGHRPWPKPKGDEKERKET